MSPISDLPADRQAVLSLLVKQRRTYAQVAAMLKIEPEAVRTRALDAVGTLGGPAPSGISDQERDQIADYLLGQLDESARIETLALLLDTAPGRAWARRVADELAPIAGDALPAVPDDPDEPSATTTWAEEADDEPDDEAYEDADEDADEPGAASAPPRAVRKPRAPSTADQERSTSGRGVAVLAAAAALIVAAIVVVIVNSGSSSLPTGPIPASAATATASSTTTTAAGTGSTGTTGVSNEIALKATAAGGRASAAVAVVNASSGPELAFTAKNLTTPPAGGEYVLWLYNSASQFHALGVVPSPTNGTVNPVAVALPSDAGSYQGVVVTVESGNRPTKPGTIVLEGASTSPL